MVLAHRHQPYLAAVHHLVVAVAVEVRGQYLARVLPVAAEHLVPRSHHALRRVEQPLAVDVLAEVSQERPDGLPRDGLGRATPHPARFESQLLHSTLMILWVWRLRL